MRRRQAPPAPAPQPRGEEDTRPGAPKPGPRVGALAVAMYTADPEAYEARFGREAAERVRAVHARLKPVAGS